MYDVVALSKILDLQYTRASKKSFIKINELVIDVKMPGYDQELVAVTEMKTAQEETELLKFDEYKYFGLK